MISYCSPTDNFYNILNDAVAPEYINMKEYLQAELQAARDNGERVRDKHRCIMGNADD